MNMARNSWIARAVLIAPLILASGVVMAADASRPTKKNNTQQEPVVMQKATEARLAIPASQHELWQRLLKLLAEDEGFTPKDRVEAVLGIRFAETQQETDPPTVGAAYVHSLEIETEGLGLFRVTLFDDPRKTRLIVGWGSGIHCLSFKKATEDLHRHGWANGERFPDYRTGNSQLEFYRPEEIDYTKTNERSKAAPRSQSYSTLRLNAIGRAPGEASGSALSDCLNFFSANIWRTPLHKQPANINTQE